MKNKTSLKLICLALVVALACGLAACKGFGHSSKTADPDSGEEAASTPKTEILASLTDKELQEPISGEVTIDQIAEKRAEAAAESAAASGSADSASGEAASSGSTAPAETPSESSSPSQSTESAGNTTETPAEAAYEAEIRTLINQLYAVRARAESGLNSAIASAKAEYKALPAEKQTTARKISICMGKSGQLKSLESSCDKEVADIVGQMRTILTENGQPTTLADQAMSTYKAEKNAMYSSLMSQLYH